MPRQAPSFAVGQRFIHRNMFNPDISGVWEVVANTKRHVRFVIGEVGPWTQRPKQRSLTHRQAAAPLAEQRLVSIEPGIAIAIIPAASHVEEHRWEDEGGRPAEVPA